MEGDLSYGLGETQKTVPVRLLELGENDGLLEDKQVKQFVMDLSNPRQGAKLGRYPRTTVTIADQPGKGHARLYISVSYPHSMSINNSYGFCLFLFIFFQSPV